MQNVSTFLGPFYLAIYEKNPQVREDLLEAGLSLNALFAMDAIHLNYQKSGLDYLLYRITQFVKTIFLCSDSQIATRELRAHVAVHVLLDIATCPLRGALRTIFIYPFVNEVNHWTRTEEIVQKILSALTKTGSDQIPTNKETIASGTEEFYQERSQEKYCALSACSWHDYQHPYPPVGMDMMGYNHMDEIYTMGCETPRSTTPWRDHVCHCEQAGSNEDHKMGIYYSTFDYYSRCGLFAGNQYTAQILTGEYSKKRLQVHDVLVNGIKSKEVSSTDIRYYHQLLATTLEERNYIHQK